MHVVEWYAPRVCTLVLFIFVIFCRPTLVLIFMPVQTSRFHYSLMVMVFINLYGITNFLAFSHSSCKTRVMTFSYVGRVRTGRDLQSRGKCLLMDSIILGLSIATDLHRRSWISFIQRFFVMDWVGVALFWVRIGCEWPEVATRLVRIYTPVGMCGRGKSMLLQRRRTCECRRWLTSWRHQCTRWRLDSVWQRCCRFSAVLGARGRFKVCAGSTVTQRRFGSLTTVFCA